MNENQTPSPRAIAFAKAWLGIEHEPQDWDVGIWGGDYAQVGESFFNLIDEPSNGPRSNSERDNIETELVHAFAELLDLYAAQEAREMAGARVARILAQLNTLYEEAQSQLETDKLWYVQQQAVQQKRILEIVIPIVKGEL